MDTLIDIKELAKRLGVSIDSVRRWYRKDRSFPVQRFGWRTIRFQWEEVLDYIRKKQ